MPGDGVTCLVAATEHECHGRPECDIAQNGKGDEVDDDGGQQFSRRIQAQTGWGDGVDIVGDGATKLTTPRTRWPCRFDSQRRRRRHQGVQGAKAESAAAVGADGRR